ncbi:MAG TPA: CpsD/CapB family tyrosine-protein kinase [Vicinamibacterales bacterium]|jgi:capsular exopolysaccharide synthesis family protein|nr:CpsD/CapB family tyrosine-protein kinase [Vicinamibacterales bacterium]
MSRIDEAMRRAAGVGAVEPEPEQTVEDLQPEESSDAKALAREPYPAEVPERRERPAQSQNRDRAQGSYDTAGQAEPAAPESTLFERLDARLTEKIVVDHNMSPASREQYRRLAAVLHDAHNTSGLRLIMVASAVAGEGKTLTASNLALTFSESYQKRVLLIDADLRRPSLHTVFRLDTALGLGDGLLSTGETKMLVRQVSPRLAVLPAGRPSSDPMAGLTSERMRRLLEEAKQSFDWVILDTPPVMLLPDAHLLASMVEGAVLVVRAGSTPHDLVKRSADAIGRSRILGVVLNRAEAQGRHDDHYQYYGYSERGGADIARL